MLFSKNEIGKTTLYFLATSLKVEISFDVFLSWAKENLS